MSIEVADLFVTLSSVTDPFSSGLKSAAADAESQSSRIGGALAGVAKIGLGLAAVAGGVAAASLKMSTTFDAQMEMLNTQAGVSQTQIAGLSTGVLSLAGQVGFSPDSLATALFHVESSFASVGITGPQALNLLKIAAQGAAVGHANLVDVTNALDAAVVSGIPGVQNYSQAMGILNATVGAGDMTMQDLADSFSSGLLATVKGYGLSITDVGAALAVFGDNNIRGATAATDLRMSVQSMAVPVSTAGAELKKLGLTSTTLADTMQTGGLLPALELLKQKMDAANVSTAQQGQVLTDLFGKKAGTGMNVLIDQLSRLQGKYPVLTASADNFANAWATTKTTVRQQLNEIEASFQAAGVRIGEYLTPKVSSVLGAGISDIGQFSSGISGSATAAAVQPAPTMGNSALNTLAAQPPPLTQWQQYGEDLRTDWTTLETDGKAIWAKIGGDVVSTAKNFLVFAQDVDTGAENIARALAPTVELFGTGLFLAVVAVGKVLADVAGPAIKDFTDFLSGHQGLIKDFAIGVIGLLTTKMIVLGTVDAATGLIGLATSIVQFPLGQAKEIGGTFDDLKAAWSGTAATEEKDAVVGLKGAMVDLKTSAGGVLDKFSMFNGSEMSGMHAGLTQATGDISKMTTAIEEVEVVAGESEQLGLFETNLKGIVQVTAGPEQLGLFETNMRGIVQVAESAPAALSGVGEGLNTVEGAATEAEGASSSMLGSLGKFAMTGTVIVAAVAGLAMLSQKLGEMAGVGDHTTLNVDQLTTALKLSSDGSTQASAGVAQLATQFVQMSSLLGKPVAGLTQIDGQLASMASGGNLAGAKSQMDAITTALEKQGMKASQVASEFPQYEQAVKDAGQAAQTTAGQVSGLLGTLGQQQALTQINTDLLNLTGTLQTNGQGFASNTAAGLANQSAIQSAASEILNYYQQQTASTGPTAQATALMQKQVTQLETTASQFGITKGDVDSYFGALLNIPSSVGTTVTANVTEALSSIYSVQQALAKVGASGGGPITLQGGQSITRYAAGGSFNAGQIAIVGEDGPELVAFGASGYVTPTSMLKPATLSGAGAQSAAQSGGSVTYVKIVNNIAGSMITEQQMTTTVRTQVLQYALRNGGNGLSLTRSP